MKVYIIYTTDKFDDIEEDSIVKIFDSREKADAWILENKVPRRRYWINAYDVE